MPRALTAIVLLAATTTACYLVPCATATAQYGITAIPVAAPVVTYSAERYGLFGQRIVYRPQWNYMIPLTTAVPTVALAPAPVTTYYAPSIAAWPAPATVTARYAPVTAPLVGTVNPAPLSTYYAPTTTYYAPTPYVPALP